MTPQKKEDKIMAISKRRMETAIKKYNKIMYQLCLEHNTIGTKLSERTEEWNLRDMVSECQYQLDCFNEEGHDCYEALHALDDGCTMTLDDLMDGRGIAEYQRKFKSVESAKADMKALRGFINQYKKDISDMECHQGHCSMWD